MYKIAFYYLIKCTWWFGKFKWRKNKTWYVYDWCKHQQSAHNPQLIPPQKSRPMFSEAGLSLSPSLYNIHIYFIYIYICIAGLIARRTRLHKYFRLAGNNNIEIKESSEQQIRYPLVSTNWSPNYFSNYPYENDHVGFPPLFSDTPKWSRKEILMGRWL